MTTKRQRKKQRKLKYKNRYLELAKGITNALLNGEATDIRIAAEGLARVVMLDRNRIRKLGHNAMLMWLAFTAMIEDMDKLSRELDERHDDGISNHSPTGKPDLSPS